MEDSRLGVKSELELLAYTTGTAMPYPSRVCDLHHSSQQRQIFNPLSKARDRTRMLTDTSQICFRCATMGTPLSSFLNHERTLYLCFYVCIYFWLYPRHAEVPGPGIKPTPQQRAQALQ